LNVAGFRTISLAAAIATSGLHDFSRSCAGSVSAGRVSMPEVAAAEAGRTKRPGTEPGESTCASRPSFGRQDRGYRAQFPPCESHADPERDKSLFRRAPTLECATVWHSRRAIGARSSAGVIVLSPRLCAPARTLCAPARLKANVLAPVELDSRCVSRSKSIDLGWRILLKPREILLRSPPPRAWPNAPEVLLR